MATSNTLKEFSPDVINLKPPRPALRVTLPAPAVTCGDISPITWGDRGEFRETANRENATILQKMSDFTPPSLCGGGVA